MLFRHYLNICDKLERCYDAKYSFKRGRVTFSFGATTQQAALLRMCMGEEQRCIGSANIEYSIVKTVTIGYDPRFI